MNPSLRKAAILVSALDSAAADQLLEQMGEQQAARVRNAVMGLDNVDPGEQEAILAEFFGQPQDHAAADHGVELMLSSSTSDLRQTSESPSTPRFQFLHNAASDELAGRLRDEHPQLIALVVVHLSAEKAAELLEHLPRSLREEVLDRLVEVDDANIEVIAELESALQRMFAGVSRGSRWNGPRHDHVQAILGHLQRNSQRSAAVAPHPANRENSPTTIEMRQTQRRTLPQDVPTAIPEIAFEQMMSLSAADFFAVFDEADPRVVMLALAGAPRRLFERYIAQFSTSRALEFERHLEQLRPLRLRDVAAAQQELATLAGRRWQTARVAAEKSRRFAAAA